MRKIISFSLFGDNPKYLVGLEKNLVLARKHYPGWDIAVYYDKSVPENYIKNLNGRVQLINMTDSPLLQSMWRFLAHDIPNVERFIIRDADSRISRREEECVNLWIESGKILHLMRDHPHHGYVIMGGMWGMIPQEEFNMAEECKMYLVKNPHKSKKWSMTDMDFLRDVVYPRYGHDSKVHASYAKFESWAEDFPSPLVDKKFVGEIWQADDSRDYQKDII